MPDVDFERAVRQEFRFLENLGFSFIRGSTRAVLYRKGDLEIEVRRDLPHYDLDINIVFDGLRYSFGDVIRDTDPEFGKAYRTSTAGTQSALTSGLSRLAGLLRRYGEGALQGTPEYFCLLAQKRKRWADEWCLEMRLQEARTQADEVFKRGEY